MAKNHRKYYFSGWILLSIALHISLLLWLMPDQSIQKKGNHADAIAPVTVSIVDTASYSHPEQQTRPLPETHSEPVYVSVATQANSNPAISGQKPATNNSQPLSKPASSITRSQPIETQPAGDEDEFADILHEAIEKHKFYPQVSLRRQQQGTARVSFTIYSDGMVDNIEIVSTSGHRSLDKSAEHAVKSISPFEPAREYLSTSKQFIVDIVFRI